MPSLELLERLLAKKQAEFDQLDSGAQHFVHNRILAGHSSTIRENLDVKAFSFYEKRRRISTPSEQDEDHRRAEIFSLINIINQAFKIFGKPGQS